MARRSSNFNDVFRMHRKHGLPIGTSPSLLTGSARKFREEFLREELIEFEQANAQGDLEGAADALIDLTVVAMGTAVMMGLPWHALWDDVHRANMAKERAPSSRAGGEDIDLRKPEGWVGPQTGDILSRFSRLVEPAAGDPHVICLCGSTRFREEYEYWNRVFTLQGRVVLSVGVFKHDDSELTATQAAELDALHLHKIEMADAIFVIDVDGYVGESTKKEIAHAQAMGKSVVRLSEVGGHADHP